MIGSAYLRSAKMPTLDPKENVLRIFTDHLERKGHRKTPERFAILSTVYEHDGHFDIERLYTRMKMKKYRVSRATLYNTMDLLMECELVRRHQFGSSPAQYEKTHAFRQHDHMICTSCGNVLEFCDPRIQSIRSTASAMTGFQVHHHALHLYGLCPQCQTRTDRT